MLISLSAFCRSAGADFPGAATPAPAGQVYCANLLGNVSRNSIYGPRLVNLDFSVLKNTHIGEHVNAQFRAEFFNITNHPNFALPSNVLAAPNFGELFQTPDAAQNNVGLGSGGPRLIQFAVKLSF